jgi:hypothetical protein
LKPSEPRDNHLYEGLFSMMQNVIRGLDKLDKVQKPASRIKKVKVRKDKTIYPLRGSGLT